MSHESEAYIVTSHPSTLGEIRFLENYGVYLAPEEEYPKPTKVGVRHIP
jgi:hypothetical protein